MGCGEEGGGAAVNDRGGDAHSKQATDAADHQAREGAQICFTKTRVSHALLPEPREGPRRKDAAMLPQQHGKSNSECAAGRSVLRSQNKSGLPGRVEV